MKKLFVIFLISSFANTMLHAQSTTPQTATEQLPKWFTFFQDIPELQAFMDSIKNEYPYYLNDVRFLDSAQGMMIDFVCLIHGTGKFSTEKSMTLCQRSINELIEHSDYILLCDEGLFPKGKVTLNRLCFEKIKNEKQVIKMKGGGNVTIRINQKDFLSQEAQQDFAIRRLIEKKSVPCIIAEEPKWVYLMECDFIDNYKSYFEKMPDQARQKSLHDFFYLLSEVRSEIAVARTARYLWQTYRGKKAVLVYGLLHMKDFKKIAARYGLISNFIVTKECDWPK